VQDSRSQRRECKLFGFLETPHRGLCSSFPVPASDCQACASYAWNLWMNVAAVWRWTTHIKTITIKNALNHS
jgi:hypothetical protein